MGRALHANLLDEENVLWSACIAATLEIQSRNSPLGTTVDHAAHPDSYQSRLANKTATIEPPTENDQQNVWNEIDSHFQTINNKTPATESPTEIDQDNIWNEIDSHFQMVVVDQSATPGDRSSAGETSRQNPLDRQQAQAAAAGAASATEAASEWARIGFFKSPGRQTSCVGSESQTLLTPIQLRSTQADRTQRPRAHGETDGTTGRAANGHAGGETIATVTPQEVAEGSLRGVCNSLRKEADKLRNELAVAVQYASHEHERANVLRRAANLTHIVQKHDLRLTSGGAESASPSLESFTTPKQIRVSLPPCSQSPASFSLVLPPCDVFETPSAWVSPASRVQLRLPPCWI